MKSAKKLTVITILWFAGLASLNYMLGVTIDPIMLMVTAIACVVFFGFNQQVKSNGFTAGLAAILAYVMLFIFRYVGMELPLDILALNIGILSVNITLFYILISDLSSSSNLSELLEFIPQSDRVMNLSAGEEQVTREFYRASRFDRNVSLVYCSLSKPLKENKVIPFNNINDSTQSLQLLFMQSKLVQSICSLIYKDDIIMNYKDGFLVCLPEASEKDTTVFLDNLVNLIDEKLSVGLTAGYAIFPTEGLVFHQVAQTAFDKAHNWKHTEKVDVDETIHYRAGDLAVSPMRRYEIEEQTQWLNTLETNSIEKRHRQERIKSIFDITLTLILLPIVLPTMALVALLIKLDDGGSIIYRQERTGFNGQRFQMFKFRTMKPNSKSVKPQTIEINGVTRYIWPEKNDNDDRITRVGRVLRKTSLDELPQLFNILRGDMTFVGPRPTSWDLDRYTSHQRNRLTVRPGITGLWQVSARDATNFDERLIWDTKYIEKMNLWLDLRIIFMTFTSVIKRKGA